jgi:hypothetical protein
VKAKFVADIMDAWPETFYRVVPKWMLLPLRCVARKIYTKADAVSAVSKRYIELAKGYGAMVPMHCCNHGIEIREEGRAKREEGRALRLVYIGAMGLSYDLETVIDAVKSLGGATLDLAGSGPKEASLRQQAFGCERIRFHGYLGDVELRDLLLRDKAWKMTMVANEPGKGVQEAILTYQVLHKTETLSRVRIQLQTGRTHQIRVQFASRGMPLIGERKYSTLQDDCEIALWSYRIAFAHPKTGKKMEFLLEPPEVFPWTAC